MIRVADFMRTLVYTLTSDQSLCSAAGEMEHRRVGCLVVVDRGQIVGVITSRDVRRPHPNRLVADAMTRDPVTIVPRASLGAAHTRLTEADVEHLPVVDEGMLVGIITLKDVLKEMVTADALTGLRNVEYLRQHGPAFVAESPDVAVVFIDLNGFGELNKQRGHVWGDQCLQAVGRQLTHQVEPAQDLLCRFGGDEFVVLTRRRCDRARVLALALVQAIGQQATEREMAVSACAGVAGGQRQGLRPDADPRKALDDLFNLASQACARAKEHKQPIWVHDWKGEPPGGESVPQLQVLYPTLGATRRANDGGTS